MAYLKPGSFTVKVANKVAMRTTLWGVHTLRVSRRNSARNQDLPVIPVEVDGHLYIVSTRGESDWVRNVRAAGRVGLGQKGDLRDYTVTEVPVAEREPVITAYRKKAGREVEQYWKKLPDPADHPLFRLTPA
ncbi:MAG: nitroreductase/quinone reductase family protein [Oryzihumus sp.]